MPAATVDIVIREQGAAAVKQKVTGIGNSLKAIGGIAKSIVAPIAGIFTIGAIVNAGKKIADFDRQLTVTAIQGRASAAQQEVLRQSILKTAAATGIGRENLLSYISSVTDATGNIQFAADTLDLVSKASVATGADLNGLGQMTADMAMKFGLSGKEIGDSLGVMIEQGDRGRLTLAEMARVAPEAMSVAGLAGMKGAAGVREMGAMLQIVRQGYGSAEEAATGFKTMVAQVYSAQNKANLKKLGVQIEDPKTGKLRGFTDIFLDVIEKTKGATPALMEIFGTRGILGAAPFAQLFKDAGGSIEAVRKELDKLEGVTADATTIGKKFGRMEDTAAVKIAKVKEQFVELLEKTVLTPDMLNAVAASLQNLAVSAQFLAEILGFAKEWWTDILGGKKKAGEAFNAAMQGFGAGGGDLTKGVGYAATNVLASYGVGWAQKAVHGLSMGGKSTAVAEDIYAGAAFGLPQSMAGAGGQATTTVPFADILASQESPEEQRRIAESRALYAEDQAAIQRKFEDILSGMELNVKVSVLNADGATVEIKDPTGKLKPGKGASAQ